MALLIRLALLSLAVAAAASAQGDGEVAAAIRNGRDAPPGRYRYMASLVNAATSEHFCSGTLVAPSLVLAAAHCFRGADSGLDELPEQFLPRVRIGGHRLSAEGRRGGWEERRAVRTLVHPGFVTGFTEPLTWNLMNRDVALLLLDKPSAMTPLRLSAAKRKARWRNSLPNATHAVVLGWGYLRQTQREDVHADALQMLRTRVLPLRTCQQRVGRTQFEDEYGEVHAVAMRFDTNAMMCCARFHAPLASGVCGGDSGGPLLVEGAGAGSDLQVGVTSWGSFPCGARLPSVFTDVATVRAWLDKAAVQLTGRPLPSRHARPPDRPRPVVVRVPPIVPRRRSLRDSKPP